MKALIPSTAIRNFLQNYAARQLLPGENGLRLLVGVSGGPDSVALLHALHRLSPALNLEIQVAHLNHLMRGEEARQDAEYMVRLCESLGLICHFGEFDVPAFATRYKLSPEDAARRVRFTFFAGLLSRLRLPLLLLAHNADDQAETIMLRLLRGTGPHGLTGIAPLAPLPTPDARLSAFFELDLDFLKTVQVGRPLLAVWRNAIEAYCREHKLEPRHDATNASHDYARNRVRLELLPYIEENFKPGFKAGLVRLSNLMRDEQALLDYLVETGFEQQADLTKPDQVEFQAEYFGEQLPGLQRRLLRRAYLQLAGSLENLDAEDIEPLLALNFKEKYLPGGVIGYVNSETVGLRLARKEPTPTQEVFELEPPGAIESGQGWRLKAEIVSRENLGDNFLKTQDKNLAYLDYDLTGPKLVVRSRKPGEKYQPLGAPGHRKVQDIMLDAKMARELRIIWPLVVRAEGRPGPEEIIWIPGVSISQHFKVTEQTTTVLLLRFSQQSTQRP